VFHCRSQFLAGDLGQATVGADVLGEVVQHVHIGPPGIGVGAPRGGEETIDREAHGGLGVVAPCEDGHLAFRCTG